VILVCGAADDEPVVLLLSALEAAGVDFGLLDLRTYPGGYLLSWTSDGRPPRGTLRGHDFEVELERVAGVFVRHASSAAAPTLSPALHESAALEAQAALVVILEQLPCRVVNRHNAGLANSSKWYQSRLIRAAGFRVPVSLVTTDASTAEQFSTAYLGGVIIKPLSGIRAIVRRVEPRDIDRLRRQRARVPIYLQAYVPGVNIRVHVVGDQVFATRCRSNVIDYRHAASLGGETTLEPMQLPAHVEDACRQLNDSSGLLLSGIDLKRTPEGEYYCFEVNPSPVFSWYETQTDQPISTAIVNLLARSA